MSLELDNISEGMEIMPLEKTVSQERVNRYAEASGDFNPIHLDEEFARQTPAGGRIAHGMLILAYLSEMMTAAFGQRWLTGGKLDVRFKVAARPGDVIRASGQVTRLETIGTGTLVHCDVLCASQAGETIITGRAAVFLPLDAG